MTKPRDEPWAVGEPRPSPQGETPGYIWRHREWMPILRWWLRAPYWFSSGDKLLWAVADKEKRMRMLDRADAA